MNTIPSIMGQLVAPLNLVKGLKGGTTRALPIAAGLCAGTLNAQTVYGPETFDTTPIVGVNLSELGGTTPEIVFGEWTGSPLPASNTITGGVINLDSGNNSRGIGVVLDPDLFTPGIGVYELSFDVLGITEWGAGDAIRVSVHGGSGYDLSGSTTARLAVDTADSNAANLESQITLKAFSGAAASELAALDLIDTDANTTQTLQFNYDGFSAVALLFGSSGGPAVEIDNVSIATAGATSTFVIGIGEDNIVDLLEPGTPIVAEDTVTVDWFTDLPGAAEVLISSDSDSATPGLMTTPFSTTTLTGFTPIAVDYAAFTGPVTLTMTVEDAADQVLDTKTLELVAGPTTTVFELSHLDDPGISAGDTSLTLEYDILVLDADQVQISASDTSVVTSLATPFQSGSGVLDGSLPITIDPNAITGTVTLTLEVLDDGGSPISGESYTIDIAPVNSNKIIAAGFTTEPNINLNGGVGSDFQQQQLHNYARNRNVFRDAGGGSWNGLDSIQNNSGANFRAMYLLTVYGTAGFADGGTTTEPLVAGDYTLTIEYEVVDSTSGTNPEWGIDGYLLSGQDEYVNGSETNYVKYDHGNSLADGFNAPVAQPAGSSLASLTQILDVNGTADVATTTLVQNITVAADQDFLLTFWGLDQPDINIYSVTLEPAVATSEIAISSIEKTGATTADIAFTSSGNVDVYKTTDLQDWTSLGNPYATDQLTGTYTDSTATEDKAFYILVPTGATFP